MLANGVELSYSVVDATAGESRVENSGVTDKTLAEGE